jgi:hypothetical protein
MLSAPPRSLLPGTWGILPSTGPPHRLSLHNLEHLFLSKRGRTSKEEARFKRIKSTANPPLTLCRVLLCSVEAWAAPPASQGLIETNTLEECKNQPRRPKQKSKRPVCKCSGPGGKTHPDGATSCGLGTNTFHPSGNAAATCSACIAQKVVRMQRRNISGV